MPAATVTAGDISFYTSRFLNFHDEVILNFTDEAVADLSLIRVRFNSNFFWHGHDFLEQERADELAGAISLFVYFSDPEKGSMIDRFNIGAGDANHNEQYIPDSTDPARKRTHTLIAYRGSRETDVPGFISSLFNLRYLAGFFEKNSRIDPNTGQVLYEKREAGWIPDFIIDAVLKALKKGLIEKYGETEGRIKAKDWLQQYLNAIRRRPELEPVTVSAKWHLFTSSKKPIFTKNRIQRFIREELDGSRLSRDERNEEDPIPVLGVGELLASLDGAVVKIGLTGTWPRYGKLLFGGINDVHLNGIPVDVSRIAWISAYENGIETGMWVSTQVISRIRRDGGRLASDSEMAEQMMGLDQLIVPLQQQADLLERRIEDAEAGNRGALLWYWHPLKIELRAVETEIAALHRELKKVLEAYIKEPAAGDEGERDDAGDSEERAAVYDAFVGLQERVYESQHLTRSFNVGLARFARRIGLGSRHMTRMEKVADPRWTMDHVLRVTMRTLPIAYEHGLRGKKLKEIVLAALVHDLGKTRTSKFLLNAVPAEMPAGGVEEIRQHVMTGGVLFCEAYLFFEYLKTRPWPQAAVKAQAGNRFWRWLDGLQSIFGRDLYSGIKGSVPLTVGPVNETLWDAGAIRWLLETPRLDTILRGLKIDSPLFRMVNAVILEHHETLDAAGYPFGLKNENDISHIVQLADIHDAARSPRPYKRSRPKSWEEIAEIRALFERGSGVRFLPPVVEAWKRVRWQEGSRLAAARYEVLKEEERNYLHDAVLEIVHRIEVKNVFPDKTARIVYDANTRFSAELIADALALSGKDVRLINFADADPDELKEHPFLFIENQLQREKDFEGLHALLSDKGILTKAFPVSLFSTPSPVRISAAADADAEPEGDLSLPAWIKNFIPGVNFPPDSDGYKGLLYLMTWNLIRYYAEADLPVEIDEYRVKLTQAGFTEADLTLFDAWGKGAKGLAEAEKYLEAKLVGPAGEFRRLLTERRESFKLSAQAPGAASRNTVRWDALAPDNPLFERILRKYLRDRVLGLVPEDILFHHNHGGYWQVYIPYLKSTEDDLYLEDVYKFPLHPIEDAAASRIRLGGPSDLFDLYREINEGVSEPLAPDTEWIDIEFTDVDGIPKIYHVLRQKHGETLEEALNREVKKAVQAAVEKRGENFSAVTNILKRQVDFQARLMREKGLLLPDNAPWNYLWSSEAGGRVLVFDLDLVQRLLPDGRHREQPSKNFFVFAKGSNEERLFRYKVLNFLYILEPLVNFRKEAREEEAAFVKGAHYKRRIVTELRKMINGAAQEHTGPDGGSRNYFARILNILVNGQHSEHTLPALEKYFYGMTTDEKYKKENIDEIWKVLFSPETGMAEEKLVRLLRLAVATAPADLAAARLASEEARGQNRYHVLFRQVMHLLDMTGHPDVKIKFNAVRRLRKLQAEGRRRRLDGRIAAPVELIIGHLKNDQFWPIRQDAVAYFLLRVSQEDFSRAIRMLLEVIENDNELHQVPRYGAVRDIAAKLLMKISLEAANQRSQKKYQTVLRLLDEELSVFTGTPEYRRTLTNATAIVRSYEKRDKGAGARLASYGLEFAGFKYSLLHRNQDIVEKFDAIRNVEKVVDMGSGMSAEFVEAGADWRSGTLFLGYELPPREPVDHKALPRNLVLRDATNTGLSASSVDLVTINMPSPPTIPDLLPPMFAEAGRILKPGGRVIVTLQVPAPGNEGKLISYLPQALAALDGSGLKLEREPRPLAEADPLYPSTSYMRLVERTGKWVCFTFSGIKQALPGSGAKDAEGSRLSSDEKENFRLYLAALSISHAAPLDAGKHFAVLFGAGVFEFRPSRGADGSLDVFLVAEPGARPFVTLTAADLRKLRELRKSGADSLKASLVQGALTALKLHDRAVLAATGIEESEPAGPVNIAFPLTVFSELEGGELASQIRFQFLRLSEFHRTRYGRDVTFYLYGSADRRILEAVQDEMAPFSDFIRLGRPEDAVVYVDADENALPALTASQLSLPTGKIPKKGVGNWWGLAAQGVRGWRDASNGGKFSAEDLKPGDVKTESLNGYNTLAIASVDASGYAAIAAHREEAGATVLERMKKHMLRGFVPLPVDIDGSMVMAALIRMSERSA